MSFPKQKDSPQKEIDLNKVFMISLLVLGNMYFLCLLVRGSYQGYVAYRLQTTGRTVIGTVIDQRVVKDTKPNQEHYFPIIEYEVNGVKYTQIGRTASGHIEYETGSRVEMLYDPATPAIARINKWEEIWFSPGFILIFVPVAATLGNVLIFLAWQRHKRHLQLYDERHKLRSSLDIE